MIRELERREREKARKLWEAVFPEDSERFLDAYAEIRRDNRITVAEEKEEFLAMIHWNPFEICYGKIGNLENRTRVCYIVGVATRADVRRRGYMRELLVNGMREMRRDGQPFTFLMPADEAIYAPFGFRTVYEQSIQTGVKGVFCGQESVSEAELSLLAEMSEAILKEKYDVYCVRNPEYLSRLIREMASEDGRVIRLGSGEVPEGYCAVWPGERPEVRELVCRDSENCAAELGLLPVRERPKIMFRMLDMEAFVRPLCSEEHREILLHMEDPIFVENTGDFRLIVDKTGAMLEELTEGEVLSAASLEAKPEERFRQVTPELLTDWMFGITELPWGQGIRRPTKIFLNESV
ncbi:MAG: GNAT family N-acetyltransferase [Lachnospiraceae bacterium]|nr:GNAT family N-acetyltransferase [Lachnospiraceae bacterium]